ncbi:MAG: hypothetical protein IJI62_08760 [Lachnospiraceae bacterium]|nr:hypothetical protein [Lachnospiraceae bacterium]
MNEERLILQIRDLCDSPQPENKSKFFQYLKEQEMMNRRHPVISHGEFLAGQLFYIGKWIWMLAGCLLLFIVWISYRHPGNYPFALTPLLAAGILLETRRSFRWKMAEFEHAARFSLRSVILARLFLLGTVNTTGLLIVILIVRPCFSYSLLRVFLYMMVPYLTASWLGSVYERMHRADQGLGSTMICILSSAFFAAVPAFFSWLFEERLTVFWTAALVLITCSLAGNLRKWTRNMEEPVWN